MNTLSFGVLIGRALVAVRAHLGFYALLALGAIAVEWCIYRYENSPAVITAAGIVVTAIVDAIVFARCKGDLDGESAGAVWGRVLERLWAVVIVSFILTFVTDYGLSSLAQGDIADRILAIPLLLIAASLIFAEAVAVVIDEDHWWFLVVRAIGTSIRTAWTGATMRRAIALFTLELLPIAAASMIATALAPNHHPPASSFWTDVPLGILCSIPLDVLIVLAFFDASGYESKRTCGE